MKFVSMMALGVSLALGTTALVAVQPAEAQKKKEEKAPSYKLSKPVREAVAAAQALIKANDFPGAEAKLGQAKAAATTEDDRYVVGSVGYDLARAQNSLPKQGEAIDMMLASGRVPASNLATFYFASGQIAYNNKDMAKAEQRLNQAIQAGVTDPNAYALLAEAKNQGGKPAEALAAIEQGIAKQKAAGQPAPNEWYTRAISIGYSAKLGPQLEKLTQDWLTAYPSPSNWRDSLTIYREVNKIDGEQDLDVMRLMRTAGALKGERDYMDYVQATYLKFPAEANAVIDEGASNGTLNLASNKNASEIKALVKGKVASDKTATNSAANDVKAGKGTAKLAVGTADALYGYGDFAQAAALYRLALQKGGVDTNLVNTRLGASLARSGDKEGAKQAFAAVTGPRAALARYWTVWLDRRA
ncbi:MAG: hypothetical protein JWN59_800 [Sphingomonas bacterium]|nr:hypothetical protein [Sphingomonas bacterium]